MPSHNAKITLELAKQVLRDKGYTQRQAAPLLGVGHVHLCFVLNGHRVSARLLRKISELPPRAAVEAAPGRAGGETPSATP